MKVEKKRHAWNLAHHATALLKCECCGREQEYGETVFDQIVWDLQPCCETCGSLECDKCRDDEIFPEMNWKEELI